MITDLQKEVSKIEATPHPSDASSTKMPKASFEYHELIESQDVFFRDKIIDAIEAEITSKSRTRKVLLGFYFVYATIVTIVSFYLITLDNVPDAVKLALVGTLLVNVISIMVVITKYAFSSEEWLIRQFDTVNHSAKSKLIATARVRSKVEH